MTGQEDVRTEFSRPVEVEDLGEDEEVFEIDADAGERAALARRFDLLDLARLGASVRVRRAPGEAVRMRAEFWADVTQSCVVSLDPVSSHLEETFTVIYAPEAPPAPGAEVLLPAEDEEMPEPLVGGVVDIGEAVAQQLGLALDPYPRRPGARFQSHFGPDEPETEAEGPFAALAALRKKAKN